jgi:hypothetical protein
MSIRDEEDRILKRLDEIQHERPEAPEAALAHALILLNHKVDLILLGLRSRPPA